MIEYIDNTIHIHYNDYTIPFDRSKRHNIEESLYIKFMETQDDVIAEYISEIGYEVDSIHAFTNRSNYFEGPVSCVVKIKLSGVDSLAIFFQSDKQLIEDMADLYYILSTNYVDYKAQHNKSFINRQVDKIKSLFVKP